MAILFDIDHENGGTTGWTGVGTGVVAHIDAALAGTGYGLKIPVVSSTNVEANKTFSGSNTNFRARWYYDASNLTIGLGETFDWIQLNKGGSNNGYIQMRNNGGDLQIQPRLRDNDGNFPTPGFVTIANSGYCEIDCFGHLTAAYFKVYINGSLAQEITGENWDHTGGGGTARWPFDDFEIGAVSSTDVGTSGDMYIDQVVANDDGSVIGEYIPGGSGRAGLGSRSGGGARTGGGGRGGGGARTA
tara:strand:+ start:4988 stop:5722 length:735 start_codon:yes stop_codon:yes gene_type:complete